jgi:hypothetical protein
MKTLFTIAFLVVLGTANAQRVIGVRGGVNINNITNTNAGGIDESNSLQSFHAGITANIPFLIFSFQPTILVTGKGSRIVYGDQSSGDYFIAETNPIYLQVPATFNLNLRFGDATGLYIGAGPYVGMGFAGSNRVHGKNDGVDFGYSNKIDFSNDDPQTIDVEEGAAYGTFRKYDYGATFNAGMYLAHLLIGVYYDHGLTKINSLSNGGQNDNMKLRTIGFTAGFVFGG